MVQHIDLVECPKCKRMIPTTMRCPWCEPNIVYSGFDMFEAMFALQNGFQQQYKERFRFTKFLTSIAILVESVELMLKTPFKGNHSYKWWSQKPVPSREERVFELVDVWHFFMLYMIKDKVTPDELFKIYITKLGENYKRQESGTY